MNLYYDPLDRACKSTTGAFPRETVLTIRVYRAQGGEDDFSAEVCNLVLGRDGREMNYYQMVRTEYGWTVSLRFHEVGLYFYYFMVGGTNLCCGKRRVGEFMQYNPRPWQITVYEEDYRTPDWLKGGIIYQIFPDRFRSSGMREIPEGKIGRKWGELPYFRPGENGKVLNNDFFGGDLNGVIEKLDYLHSLGVTVLYFNPIFEAYSNHRYDTGNYLKIDPLLGTEQDLDRLIAEAKKRGMRVILDGVFNHTGSDSLYFNREGRYPSVGAYQSTQSPYYEWYTFHSFPDSYESWWGILTLPAVNESSPSYQEFILGENGVIKTWLRHGIGGYRLDVADELPDFFLKKLRKAVKEENPDAVIIGEVWEDASNKIAYGERREYFQGAELDSVMNYPLKDAIIGFLRSGNADLLRDTVATLIDNYPAQSLHSLMNILGTHDTARILTVLGGKQCSDKEEMAVTRLSGEEKTRARHLLKLAAVLQFTLPGVPCIYYGDENGMEGYSDPFCRGCYDWEHPDKELNDFYRSLGRIRHTFSAVFRQGEYREIFADGGCLVFERRAGKKSVYVYVNHSGRRYRISFRGKFREYLGGELYLDALELEPNRFGILAKTK